MWERRQGPAWDPGIRSSEELSSARIADPASGSQTAPWFRMRARPGEGSTLELETDLSGEPAPPGGVTLFVGLECVKNHVQLVASYAACCHDWASWARRTRVQELPTGTVTFLFTDVDGSTRLLKLLGSRYGEVMDEHRRILRDSFREHGGYEIDTQGDALFVAFSRAKDAVRGAVAAQRALAAHSWPEGADVRVRMALHTGEPERSGEGYFGLGVHRAARICAAGHGGQILLSRSTAGVFEEDEAPGVEMRDLGERRLKDLERAERIYQVIAEGLQEQFPPLNTLDRAERERELLEAARAAELPTGTLTFLFTDMEGYTLLLGTMPGEEAARVMDDHDQLLREAFVAAGGRIIDNSGDSFLACFQSAKDAARGAAECHRALAAHVWPADARVAVRIGLNTGEAVAVSGRYFGLAVNRAARVCAAAHGGQALVAPSTAALLDQRELGDLTLRDLGEFELDSFDGPIHLHQLVIPGVVDRFPPLRAISRAASLRIA